MFLAVRYQIIMTFFGILILTACGNQDKVSDCKEYAKAIQLLGKLAATPVPGRTLSENTKQSYVRLLSFQTKEEWNVKIWQDMRMKSSTARQIQHKMVEVAREEHQYSRKKLEIVKFLPEDSNYEAIQSSLQSLSSIAMSLSKKVNSVFDEMDNYCKL
jgi:hypothetical protein